MKASKHDVIDWLTSSNLLRKVWEPLIPILNCNQQEANTEFSLHWPSCCTKWALRGHCVHLPTNSPKIACHLSASTANGQSPQDNNQHTRSCQCTHDSAHAL